uniref:Bifunctional protein PutA n=1 Tax=Candidatus Berkiella cookevillensis TaxID=437022 RepID=A0A0Q9Y8N5_9GAMM
MGNPVDFTTDIGPVISSSAKDELLVHAMKMDKLGKKICEAKLSDGQVGCYFAPRAYEIKSMDVLENEVFGPVLHVIRFKGRDLDKVIHSINKTGFGLTLGIHSRIDETIDYIIARVNVGNIYVNRNMIGAVVGVQPFGGEGLSGTGPKAGGPHYLIRLSTERTLSVNTTASGGNASLMSLCDNDS